MPMGSIDDSNYVGAKWFQLVTYSLPPFLFSFSGI